MPTNPTTLTVSVRDASLVTSLSEFEIRSLVNAGTLPAVRHGKRILIVFADLSAYINALPKVVETADAS